jgi:transketolase
MHYESGVGHLGGALSCLDAMMLLFHEHLRPTDDFILSKGHAVSALYVTLWSLGEISDDDLRTFCHDGTLLGAHPPANAIDRIRFATGSLGHGFSIAAGTALGCQILEQDSRIYCMTSDGEWQEGRAHWHRASAEDRYWPLASPPWSSGVACRPIVNTVSSAA